MTARPAGSYGAISGERRRSPGPYGLARQLFNALLVISSGTGLRPPAPSPRLRGEGRGEGPGVIANIVSILFAAMLSLAPAGASAAAHVPVILDFGDSLTAGYGLMPQQAFPARLEAWLHRHGIAARVVNAGVSGDTTTDGLARLDWALADKPDLVILALGANDALRGIDPVTVRANLDQMIDKIGAAHAKVLLLGMLAPPNWGEAYDRAFDRIFPDLARSPPGGTLSIFSRRCCDEA